MDDVANSHDVKHQYFFMAVRISFRIMYGTKESELYETCSDTTYDNLDWKMIFRECTLIRADCTALNR